MSTTSMLIATAQTEVFVGRLGSREYPAACAGYFPSVTSAAIHSPFFFSYYAGLPRCRPYSRIRRCFRTERILNRLEFLYKTKILPRAHLCGRTYSRKPRRATDTNCLTGCALMVDSRAWLCIKCVKQLGSCIQYPWMPSRIGLGMGGDEHAGSTTSLG